MSIRWYIFIILAIMLATSCSDSPLKPRSGGDPYEAVLLTDDKEAMTIVKGMLEHPLEGLPQPESSFKVSAVDGSSLTQATRYARTIVMVRIDENQYSQTRIKYERNVYAEPQLIVYVNTPSAAALSKDSAKVAPLLLRFLDGFEINTAISALKKKHNVEAKRKTAKMFGYEISIPAEMTYTKTGRDFIWFSDNGSTSMGSICVYSVGGIHNTPGEITRLRDSIMAVNIPGERAGMHMATEKRLPVTFRMTGNRRDITEARGLWQMEGDAMGGPFVSHTIIDTLRNRTITAEGFVYAPGKKKRNKLKRTEAALYTLKPAVLEKSDDRKQKNMK